MKRSSVAIGLIVTSSLLVWLAGVVTATFDRARATSEAFTPTFETVPCPRDVTKGIRNEVSCGYLKVPQDRSNPNGATIRVFFTTIQPPEGNPSPDPMFVAGSDLSWAWFDYAGVAPMAERTHREVIIMDQRGLGHSVPNLYCYELQWLKDPQLAPLGTRRMETEFLEAVQACHDRLTDQGIDLGSYNLAESAADAEDLRAALGIQEWNLITLGSASSISFEIMRRYPEHVRAAVFDSPAAPQVDLLTQAIVGTEYAFGQVARACSTNPKCDRRWPHLRATRDQALRRLRKQPSRFTAQGLHVLVDDATAVRVLRDALTWPESLTNLPRDIYRLRTRGFGRGFGLFNPDIGVADRHLWATDPILGQGYVLPHSGHPVRRFNYGSFYSTFCHDEAPFVDRVALVDAAQGKPWYMPAYVHSPYLQACERWDAGNANADPHDPLVSDIPTLILHGRFDPYSPLPLIKKAARTLSTSWVVEFPTLWHNILGSECGPEVRNGWIDDPTSPPDTSCVADQSGIWFAMTPRGREP